MSHQHHRGYNTASNASSASSSDLGFFSPGGGWRSPIAHSNAAASRFCCRRPILSHHLLSINAAPASQIGENDALPHSAHSHHSEPPTATAPAPAASAAFLSTVSNSPSVSSFSGENCVVASSPNHRGYNTASNASSASSSDLGFFSPGGGWRSSIAHSNAAASRFCCRRPILSVHLLSINAAPASQIGENDTLPHSAHSHRSESSPSTAPAPAASAAFLSTVSNSPSVSSFSSRTASLPAHRTTAATTPPRTLPGPCLTSTIGFRVSVYILKSALVEYRTR